uniref:Uncharacterized protein n=1 Tax=Oryza glumipatula TaxID=40148 RepID=A0A0E0BA05_9ORYZ
MAAEAAATSRFAAACGALSQYVRAADSVHRARTAAAARPLPLMPGADVAGDERPEEEGAAAVAQMTIFYGGRVLCPIINTM